MPKTRRKEESGVAVSPRGGPVNLAFLVAAASGALTWSIWPGTGGPWQQDLLAGLAASAAVLATVQGIVLTVRDYRLRRNLERAARVSLDHGSARESTPAERAALGMYDPGSGNLLGLDEDGRPVFAPKAPFSLTEMPPGGGKTTTQVVGAILHGAFRGASLFVADPKLELAPMLAPALRRLGFEVWCINPTGQFLGLCGDTEINLYQPVLDAVYADDATRQDAAMRAMDIAHLHVPDEGTKDNAYFLLGSRRAIWTAILILALLNPAYCTPSDVHALLSNPFRLLPLLRRVTSALEGPDPNDQLAAFVRDEAGNLLHLATKNKANFGVFLEQATQRLAPFNRAGRLAGVGRTAIHNLASMRERQIIVFAMSPLSHSRGFAPFLSMLNYNEMTVCKQRPRGHRLHIVGEEFLNYQFVDIQSDLEAMRGLGVTADFYIQSYAGLEKKYGREVAAAIDAYCDVKIYGGINSFEQARRISDMLSEETIRKQDYSCKSVATDLGVSSREMGRRLMTPDEILAMPRDQAWLFVRGLRPTLLTTVHYGQVDPWRDWAGDNPIEGSRLRGDPVVRINYPERTKP